VRTPRAAARPRPIVVLTRWPFRSHSENAPPTNLKARLARGPPAAHRPARCRSPPPVPPPAVAHTRERPWASGPSRPSRRPNGPDLPCARRLLPRFDNNRLPHDPYADACAGFRLDVLVCPRTAKGRQARGPAGPSLIALPSEGPAAPVDAGAPRAGPPPSPSRFTPRLLIGVQPARSNKDHAGISGSTGCPADLWASRVRSPRPVERGRRPSLAAREARRPPARPLKRPSPTPPAERRRRIYARPTSPFSSARPPDHLVTFLACRRHRLARPGGPCRRQHPSRDGQAAPPAPLGERRCGSTPSATRDLGP